MTKFWFDDIGAEAAAESSGTVEAELIEPMPARVGSGPLRTRYTDRLVRPSSNFVAHLMSIDGGAPLAGSRFATASSRATAAYRSTFDHAASASPSGHRTRRTS